MKRKLLVSLSLLLTLALIPSCSGSSGKGNTASGNANLSNITISGGISLSPAFKATTTSYTAVAGSSVTSCAVTIYGGHTSQTIEADGTAIDSGEAVDVDLSSSGKTLTIKVTAGNGTQNTYTLAINKYGTVDSEARLSSLVIKGSAEQTLSPAFSSDTLTYAVYTANSVSSVTVTPTAMSTSATVTVNGTAITSGSASGSILLTAGTPVEVTVHVTAADSSTKDYVISITRESSTISSNAYLSALTISATGTWDYLFAKNNYSYNIAVKNTVDSVTVTPVTDESHAAVTVNGAAVTSSSPSASIPLTAGQTTSAVVIVTAQDGATKMTYTLKIAREGSVSADAYLSSLSLGSVSVSPSFLKTTASYTAEVTSAVSSITVTPTAEDAAATITVNGSDVASGSSQSVTLGAAGTVTTVSVIVTAQDGTMLTYTVRITRTNTLIIYFEKPSTWSEAWLWYDSDLSTTAWNTTALKTSPGDMTYYRTENSLKWYMKDIGTTSKVQFLFNDGTWANKLQNSGVDFTATGSVWVRANGTMTTTDPITPAVPVITVSPAGGTFSSDTSNVTITVASSLAVSSMSYKIVKNSGTPVTTTMPSATATVNIASGTVTGDVLVLQVTAVNSVGTTVSDQYTFTRVKEPEVSADLDSLRIYQVMVESFQDGNSNCDYNTGYGPSSHKGDIKGITNAIPYIKSLGCNAIWLTPIFNSNGSSQLDATGYFAYDYFSIDPKFGDLQAAKDLVKAAHDAGIYVFLDGVFGHHKSSGCPASPGGYTPTGNTVNSPFSDGNYGVDYNDAGTVNFYKEVATYWIDTLEIDGWRLDQAYQIHKNNANCWNIIVDAVEAKCAERKLAGKTWGTLGYMVGEIWKGESDIKTYGYGSEGFNGLDSCFDFPMRYDLVQVLAREETNAYADRRGNTSYLSAGYASHSSYPSHAHPNLMLTNHDLVRFGDLIQRAGLGDKGSATYWSRHKAAFAFMTSYTGPVTIYYGDEIGDEVSGFVNGGDGGYYDDHVSRSNGQISGFDSNQQALHDYVASLMAIRSSHAALWNGTRTNLIASGSQYADLKVSGTDKVLFVLNAGTSDTTMSLSQTSVGGSTLTDLVSSASIAASGSSYSITVPALSGRFLQVQ
jgi:glycosidase